VAATYETSGYTGTLTGFSNYGSLSEANGGSVDIAAPGGEFFDDDDFPTNKPGIFTTRWQSALPSNSDYGENVFADGSRDIRGTSYATPMVAGTIALICSVFPDATVTQIRDALLDHVTPSSDLTGKVTSGGLLNAYEAVKWMASQNSSFSKTVIGDSNGVAAADQFVVAPYNTDLTGIYKNGSLVTTVDDVAGKRIAIFGLAGNDSFSVNSGVSNPVYFSGGRGNDTLLGNSTQDQLFGGEGHDSINAGGGNDTVYGQGGNDNITGGSQNDYLYGDNGNDTIFASDGVWDLLDGGADTDSIGSSDSGDTKANFP